MKNNADTLPFVQTRRGAADCPANSDRAGLIRPQRIDGACPDDDCL